MAKRILALAMVFLAAGTVSARADSDVVIMQQPGTVVYVDGNDADVTYVTRADAKDYGLKITNIDRNGHYVDGSEITIRDDANNILRHSAYTGPNYYTDLPAGHYIVQAGNGVQHQSYEITTGHEPANLTLFWQKI